jgi:competence protein ComEA
MRKIIMTNIKKTLPLVLLALMLLAGPAMAAAEGSQVNLNKASVEQLTELPYVGPKRAAQIVERRQQKPFQSIDELLEIKGIGPKTLEKIRPYVVVSMCARKQQ